MYFLIGIILYLLVGIIRVGYDFIQPTHNQPMYIYERQWGRIVLYIFLWPKLMYITGDFYYFWRYFKKIEPSATENTKQKESTGINRLSVIEQELKDKEGKKKIN